MFVAANAITNARKVSLFLTVIGPTIFSLLHDLFQLGDHTTKLYGELVTKLKEHWPQISECASLPTYVLLKESNSHWDTDRTHGRAISADSPVWI